MPYLGREPPRWNINLSATPYSPQTLTSGDTLLAGTNPELTVVELPPRQWRLEHVPPSRRSPGPSEPESGAGRTGPPGFPATKSGIGGHVKVQVGKWARTYRLEARRRVDSTLYLHSVRLALVAISALVIGGLALYIFDLPSQNAAF